ncbi:efflux RND transporter periplasmic adaptor subunit [Bartonella sp. F2]|nr:efflux RND transporter periplasmic adaptor subunit [Bartonella sp. F02]MCZ2328918.1 efflux RND transporter periplasmic adaptor subunit [Bartonella sp. F02]
MRLLKKIFPWVLFVVVLSIIYWGIKHKSKSVLISEQNKNAVHKTSKTSGGRPPMSVVVDSVKVQSFYEQLNAVGSGRAIAEVELTPWSAGVIDKFFVSAGVEVKAGDLIAKLDSQKEEIAVAKAKVKRDNSALTLARIMKLRATKTATEVQETSARLELDNADLVLRDAELALDRRTIRAPISGTVGILPINAGNTVTLNTVIGRIENRERILIDIWVPERYASYLHKGDEVVATLTDDSNKTFVGHIYALDNVVDEASRTLHVQVEIQNKENTLMSGMSFSVMLKFYGGFFPVVDPLAIQWNSRGSFVWRVKEGKVEYVPVSIIKRYADYIVVKAPLENNDKIVIQGVQMLYPGSRVVFDQSKNSSTTNISH